MKTLIILTLLAASISYGQNRKDFVGKWIWYGARNDTLTITDTSFISSSRNKYRSWYINEEKLLVIWYPGWLPLEIRNYMLKDSYTLSLEYQSVCLWFKKNYYKLTN